MDGWKHLKPGNPGETLVTQCWVRSQALPVECSYAETSVCWLFFLCVFFLVRGKTATNRRKGTGMSEMDLM